MLERNSEALGAESLCESLSDYASDMNVEIVESDDCYRRILDPVSGEGHDFDIELDKKTGGNTGLVVGTLEPDP